MRNSLFLILVLVSFWTAGQQISVGAGLVTDSYTLIGSNPHYVTDSILFTNYEAFVNPINGTVRGDSRESIYVSAELFSSEKLSVSAGVYYSRKYPQISLGRVADDPNTVFPIIYYRPVMPKYNFYLPVNLGVSPFSKWQMFSKIGPIKDLRIEVGVGPSFHFGNITSRIDGFDLNLDNNREDPEYYEIYYQFGRNAHRSFTFDYNLVVQTNVYRNLGVKLMGSGSLGSVTKPFTAFGNSYDVRVRRRALAVFLTYEVSL